MTSKIWDFWAKRYDKLWVQRYSLRPTRNCILKIIKEDIEDIKNPKSVKVLDLGCGPGELINLLEKKYQRIHITGIDFSQEMLNISKLKNPKTRHIKLDVKDLDKIQEKFNIIICTHSLPYYKNLEKVIIDLYGLLEDEGKIFMAFASGNNFYDKLVLSFVKLTTGPAYYPSDIQFRKLLSNSFKVESLNIIKERTFMPRIAVYKLSKVKL